MIWSFRPAMFAIRTPYDAYGDTLDAWQRVMMAGMDLMSASANAARATATMPLGQVTFNFPYSGDVTQHIAPETRFGLLEQAGDAETEQAVVEHVASYGRQLGWIVDLLDEMAAGTDGIDPDKRAKVADLKRRVDALKTAMAPGHE